MGLQECDTNMLADCHLPALASTAVKEPWLSCVEAKAFEGVLLPKTKLHHAK
jgi:hypothetical protein